MCLIYRDTIIIVTKVEKLLSIDNRIFSIINYIIINLYLIIIVNCFKLLNIHKCNPYKYIIIYTPNKIIFETLYSCMFKH